ncbi:uncharacterized protein DDB_G0271670-like isoform X2 [Osmia bicornis bicornis]|uniref:uncharacterized protein DDB_G0271670-like isoform X2 n=1 Tax=Osmia bicornis bicornis TaxID=1437191 RepID=UPI001EAED1C6|nr:uncharacterized protein DDB_G0271670-like isoform X2 [Osmia bicornis bicornis]
MSAKLIVFLAIVGATYALVASPKFRRDVESGAPASNSSKASPEPSESGAPASNSSKASPEPSESGAPASNSSKASPEPSESGAPASNSSKASPEPSESGAPASNSSKASPEPSESGAPASNSSNASSGGSSESDHSSSSSSNSTSSSSSSSNSTSNSSGNSTSAESAAASAEAAAASAKAAAEAAKAAKEASASASSSAASSSNLSNDIQKQVEKLVAANNHTAILDFGGIPNLKSWLSQIDFTNVTFVAKVPKLRSLFLLPPILGLRERIGLARARLLARLNGTDDIPTAIQRATIKAIHAPNPTKALSDLAYTILNTYHTFAANSPLLILKAAVLGEGVQLVTSSLHVVVKAGVVVKI